MLLGGGPSRPEYKVLGEERESTFVNLSRTSCRYYTVLLAGFNESITLIFLNFLFNFLVHFFFK